MALDMLDTHRQVIPHRWVLADDEFGRTQDFRAGLRQRKEAYVLDVPCSTLVRDLEIPRPPRRAGSKSRHRAVPFRNAQDWAAAQTPEKWREIHVKDGEKGPLTVRAIMTRVQTRFHSRLGPQEWLLALRTPEGEVSYHLAWAPWAVTLEEAVAAHGRRQQIEQVFQHGKGEAGLDHYEVRSYVGRHHHMTLSLVGLVIPVPAAPGAEKTPVLTVPQVWEIPTRLLRHPAPAPRTIAREITSVLTRSQKTRIYHWHALTGQFPQRLNPSGSG
jgi:SRSO17 transposase